ncbi:MAG: [LysW]-lysine hydrolase [Chloroflexi bacterium]|nr:MAG: [LysW]-lysine hydrolase [Chloroflexota bacterium]
MTEQNEAIELLTKLVSIPSPSEHERKASAFLAGWMNAHGLKSHVDEVHNAVGVKGNGPKEILLLGHIDTFPGEVPVRRDGDVLYGRGSVDAKGPLATFAAAAARVSVPKGWRISVIGAVEEESATSKGARHVLARRMEPEQHPAFCVIGEPSNWDRVTLGYKGRLLMDVTLRVPFSHSAGEGRLPAEQGVDFWRQVENLCAENNAARGAKSPFSQLSPSLRYIASHDEGAFGSVVMSLGFRLPVDISPAQLEVDMRNLLNTVAEGTVAEAQFSGGEPAYKGDKSNLLVRAFLRSIRAGDGKPRFVVKTGTADMNVVGPHWPNTPIVAYGPGDSNLDHTPNEHIHLTEYLRAVDVLAGALEQLMAG